MGTLGHPDLDILGEILDDEVIPAESTMSSAHAGPAGRGDTQYERAPATECW